MPNYPTDPNLKRRYSYSFANAQRFFPIYDRLIDIFNDPANYAAPSIRIEQKHFPGMQPATLVNRISDGLKWLVERFEIPDDLPPELRPRFKREDYQLLKLNLKLAANVYPEPCVVLTLRIVKSIGQVQSFRASLDSIPVNDPGNLLPPPINEQQKQSTIGSGISTFRASIESFLTDPSQPVIQFKNLHLTESDNVWIKNLLATTPALSHSWQGTTLTIAKEP